MRRKTKRRRAKYWAGVERRAKRRAWYNWWPGLHTRWAYMAQNPGAQ
jgi:hypothetical protein